ncbi:unnamed protein product [Schistosoma turkestanicum]|nr:unnamed protein product [Schistosoma turkestanicum]
MNEFTKEYIILCSTCEASCGNILFVERIPPATHHINPKTCLNFSLSNISEFIFVSRKPCFFRELIVLSHYSSSIFF